MTQAQPNNLDPEVQDAYRDFFREQVHHLLNQGYQSCRAQICSPQEEEEISGYLCNSIQSYMESFSSPDWCSRYSVHNEQPEAGGKETGKRRKRKDVVFEFTDTKPRLWYIFEAKRLR